MTVSGFGRNSALTMRTVLAAAAAVGAMSAVASAVTYTPAQIRGAYGFNAVPQNGAGETIAIVDFGNDPYIASDLTTFDTQFGIAAPPSFSIVNETGGSTLPANDPNGYGETTLDVEYAHAIAPGAKIVLIEAPVISSATLADVETSASTAGNLASIVSMSFGFNGGLSSSSEHAADSYFNRSSVAYVASSGDNAIWAYPASSPYVIGVGGTSLTLTAGAYTSEKVWNDNPTGTGTADSGGGGVDTGETKPGYQNGVATAGTGKTVPDVSYNADPNTGVYVYTSTGDAATTGYYSSGGTSAGAPQWAGLIALADQLRVSLGLQPLSSTDALNMMYAAYSNPVLYAALFHDVTTGSNANGVTAGVGYDAVTGLGTPIANNLVQYLAGTFVVPEPTSVAILAGATTLMMARRRRA